MDEVEKLYDAGRSYTEIAEELDMTKANVAIMVQKIKIRRGIDMADVDMEFVKRRYLDDAVEVSTLAREIGYAVARCQLYLRAHGIFRDRGTMYRAGVKVMANKGVRVPGSRRDRQSRAAKFGSDEHREKMAQAKRGKTGERSNRWKGGRLVGGYVCSGGGANRKYAHREIAKDLLGRELDPKEHVHHIDRDRTNNDPANLLVLNTTDHVKLHAAIRANPSMDQRAWLAEHGFTFYDLVTYAKDCFQEAG